MDHLTGRQHDRQPLASLQPQPADYHWITVKAEEHRFLRTLSEAFGFSSLQLWVESAGSGDRFRRTDCRGLVTAMGHFQGRPLAIAWSDFRVEAASFGQANSRRFVAFLRHLGSQGHERTPLIYIVNSAGISLMEGRAVFSDGFAIWPELLRFADQHLLLTCATGRCLGLAPLLYGLGHYRVAVAKATQVNLTGPDVIKMFFGQGIDFDRSAAAERFVATNDLIHELVPSVDAALSRFKELLFPASAVPQGSLRNLGAATGALLESFLDGPPHEVVPGWCDRMRLFIGRRRGQPLGLFVNPLERSNNLVTVRTLAKYAAGLDLMRSLRLPIVSCLDSPGIDPRFDQSEANNIRMMLSVGDKIIRYPHGSMGIVTRRCFGGASTLSFPKVFGGTRAIALRGCTIGTIHDRIIAQLLSGSPRLLEQWHRVSSQQGPELDDLLAKGILDAVIDPAGLPNEVDRFLALCSKPPVPAVGTSRRSPTRVLPFRPPRPGSAPREHAL